MIEQHFSIHDTGERILPTQLGETSFVFARHKFAYCHVQQFVENKTVIDVGCGSGYGCHILSQRAKLVCGIDHDAEIIAYCRQRYHNSKLSFLQMDATRLNLDQQFDVVINFQMIEHVEDMESFIDVLRQAAKPEGTIFISTPRIPEEKVNKGKNPFHAHDLTYHQFYYLINRKFTEFEIVGVAYAAQNRLRTIITRLPIYRWGRLLSRKSKLKKLAGRSMGLSKFKIITTDVEHHAADLLAICRNSSHSQQA
ncbi:MAG: class I SAM-dependent methyltransferase [bacterium]|nr:class I SAM-dependent methyltransferase [bacterium]